MQEGSLSNKVLDWKQDPTSAVLLGVRLKNQDYAPAVCIIGDNCSKLENCTLRNFRWLDVTSVEAVNCKFENCKFIQGTHFKTCCFENCSEIQVRDGYMEQCEIDHTETMFAHDMKMTGGAIRNCRCNAEFMVLAENVSLSGVTFENVSLTHNAYAVMGYGNIHFEDCSFKNCATDRADQQWFYQDSIGIILDDWRPFPENSMYHCVRTYSDCVLLLRNYSKISYISLDYDLEEDQTGLDVMKYIRENGNVVEHINIHSAHPDGIVKMQEFALEYFPSAKLTFDPL